MKKKKPFLLIEVLIGIYLITICLIPLVKTPIESYKSELDHLEEMERERLAEWSFLEVKEKLIKNEIPWEKLPKPKSEIIRFNLPPTSIEILEGRPKKVQRAFTISCAKEGDEKIGLSGEIYRMLTVEIELSPIPVTPRPRRHQFTLMVRRLAPSK